MLIKENYQKWQSKIDKANNDLSSRIENYEAMQNKKEQLSGLQKYENFVKWKDNMKARQDKQVSNEVRKKEHEARVKQHLDQIEEKNNEKARRVEDRQRIEFDVLKKSRDL